MFIIERMFSVVAPQRCYICKAEGSLLCLGCATDSCPLLSARCYSCHQPNATNAVCQSCSHRSPLEHVWVRANYSNWAKQLIHDFKFARAQMAAETMAHIMR